MISLSQAKAHAVLCGLDVVNHMAMPVQNAKGATLARDVIHPEDCSVVFAAGHYVSATMVRRLQAMGVDYVMVHNF